MAIEKNIRLEPHKSRDLLVSKKSNKKRPKYQPPGHRDAPSRSSGASHDRGGRQHQATAARQVAAARPRDHHPGESTGREQAIASRTYGRPNTVTYEGPHRGDGIGSQTFNKNIRTLARQQQYRQGAYQRAHPFLSRLGGIGGLLKGIGRGALGFFGGLPGKALSGIMTAKNWAKQKGTGVLDEVEEFSNYPTLDRYLNRNTGKYDDKPYRGQGEGYTFDDQAATNVTNPNLNNLGVDNQFIEEEQNFDPNFLAPGSAEGGRIGYEPGGVVEPGKQYYGKEDWEIQQINQYGVSYPEFLANQGWPPLKQMDATQIAAAADAWKAWRQSQADGGIARLL